MRSPPERYLQVLRKHFAHEPAYQEAEALQGRLAASSQLLTTHQSSKATAFQRWFHFKEAFSPSFVTTAIQALGFRPHHILDPFGGCGTTAISSQLLAIDVTTVEVNPFLADIIAAKADRLPLEALRHAAADFQARLVNAPVSMERFDHLPSTFIESASKTRWIFPRRVARRISQYLAALESVRDPSIRRFLRVALGSVLIEVSNVYVNGKGRRYRRGWADTQSTARDLDKLFAERVNAAYEDVVRFDSRPTSRVTVLEGDARQCLTLLNEPADLIVFSPPYPNSFDYTDIYNVELWILGYLTSYEENTLLRNETLRSHVQVHRAFEGPASDSSMLARTIGALHRQRESLWNAKLPDMIGAYFRDLEIILTECRRLLSARGKVIMVVGDSRYGEIRINVAGILCQIAPQLGYSSCAAHQVRKMRSSAQQGGRHHLRECVIELSR